MQRLLEEHEEVEAVRKQLEDERKKLAEEKKKYRSKEEEEDLRMLKVREKKL